MTDGLLSLSPYRARWPRRRLRGHVPGRPRPPRGRGHRRGHLPGPGAGRARPPPARRLRPRARRVDREARRRHGAGFPDCPAAGQEALLTDLEAGALPAFTVPDQREFFHMLHGHLQEGLFADPAHGGNRDKAGWRFLGHPGVWLEHSAEEQWAEEPVTKDGEVRSLADAGCVVGGSARSRRARCPATTRSAPPPNRPARPTSSSWAWARSGGSSPRCSPTRACGWSARGGGPAAPLRLPPRRARRGLLLPRRHGPEVPGRGPALAARRGRADPADHVQPRPDDERRRRVDPALRRALRRMHPHHFAYRSHIAERWGLDVLPEGCTVADWPLDYAELEPYYDLAERVAGVAGDRDANPSCRAPPTTRCRRCARPARARCSAAARERACIAYPTPACVNSVPYNGLPATRYPRGAPRSGPSTTTMAPRPDVGAAGAGQRPSSTCARTAACCGCSPIATGAPTAWSTSTRSAGATFRARTYRRGVHLRDDPAPDALRRARQTPPASWAATSCSSSAATCTATCPASRSTPTPGRPPDDHPRRLRRRGFDSVAHGFVGGASLNVENQQLPLQIARDPLPPGVRSWGADTRSTCAGGSRSRPSASSPTPCRTGPTTSTSTRATATAAGSGCRSCA